MRSNRLSGVSSDEPLELVPVGDVAGVAVRLAAHRPNLGRHLLASFELAAGDEDIGTVRGEGLHHLRTQAPAAAGYQGHLACQVEIVGHGANQDV